jgi:hypothetical protein
VRWLERPDLLDVNGGVDIFQVAPSQMHMESGSKAVRIVRLSDKGMFRSYCESCHTPMGNMVSLGIPFIGVSTAVLANGETWLPAAVPWNEQSALGRVTGSRFTKLRTLAHVTRLLLGWKLSGKGLPSPLFDDEGRPRFPVQILTAEERGALATRDISQP